MLTLAASLALAGAPTLELRSPHDVLVERPAGDGATWVRFAQAPQVEVLALPAAIVELRAGAAVPASLRARGQALGASQRYWRVPSSDGGVAEALRWREVPGVVSVLPDVVLNKTRTATFNDPLHPGQWYLEDLGAQALFDIGLGDPAVRVAVVDSAIEIGHPDLAAGIDAPYDAFDDDDDPSPNPGEFCGGGTDICDEHGTAVSGIIGARANNGEGIVGLCAECTLVPIKLLGDGSGALSRDIASFEHAIEQDAAVINNSWGYTQSIPVPAALASVIQRAATETRGGLGAVVVFAAGNDDREVQSFELQALPDVLCVSATDHYGQPTAYTNRGPSVDVSARSATVTTSHSGGYTETFGGTSAAAPVVSGIAGWVLSQRPELSATEVRQLFIDAAVPSPLVTHDDQGHHPVYGYGEVKAGALLEAMGLGEDPPDTDTPDEQSGGCSTVGGAPMIGMLGMLLLGLRRRPRRR